MMTWQVKIEWYSPTLRYRSWLVELAKKTSTEFKEIDIGGKPCFHIIFALDKIDDAYSFIKHIAFRKGIAYFINGHSLLETHLLRMLDCFYEKNIYYYIEAYCKYCPKYGKCDKKLRQTLDSMIPKDKNENMGLTFEIK